MGGATNREGIASVVVDVATESQKKPVADRLDVLDEKLRIKPEAGIGRGRGQALLLDADRLADGSEDDGRVRSPAEVVEEEGGKGDVRRPITHHEVVRRCQTREKALLLERGERR